MTEDDTESRTGTKEGHTEPGGVSVREATQSRYDCVIDPDLRTRGLKFRLRRTIECPWGLNFIVFCWSGKWGRNLEGSNLPVVVVGHWVGSLEPVRTKEGQEVDKREFPTLANRDLTGN